MKRLRRGPDFLELVLWSLGVLSVSQPAWAFGPPTHVSFGLEVLRYLGLLPAAVRAALRQYPDSFLYGTFVADAVLGKNLSRYANHCHNWDVAFQMLEEARSERLVSLSWGFLSHLAADVVAHNYFVPFHVVTSYRAQTTRHIYWEMRFDHLAGQDQEVWDVLGGAGRFRFPEEDLFLQVQLARSSRLLPFEASHRLFNSLVLVSRTERWRRATAAVATRSPLRLGRTEYERIRRLALKAIFGLLVDGREAAVVRTDPTARTVLAQARNLRRALRRRMRRGSVGQELCSRAQALLEESLLAGLVGPARLPSAAALVGPCQPEGG